jgi:Ca2+-binding EF-hand superfamily protein
MFLDMMFEAFDEDKNGLISFSEFLIGIYLVSNPNPEKKLRIIFKIYDQNANEKLEFSEIKSILNNIKHSVGEEDYENILSNLDKVLADKKYLNQDEFIQFILSEPILKKLYIDLIKTCE